MVRSMGRMALASGIALVLCAGTATAQSPKELEQAKAEVKKMEAALELQKAKIREAEERMKKEAADPKPKFPGLAPGKGGLDEKTREEIRQLVKKYVEEELRLKGKEKEKEKGKEPEKGKKDGGDKGEKGGPGKFPGMFGGGGSGIGGFGMGGWGFEKGKGKGKEPERSKTPVDRMDGLERRLDKMESQLDEITRMLRKK